MVGGKGLSHYENKTKQKKDKVTPNIDVIMTGWIQLFFKYIICCRWTHRCPAFTKSAATPDTLLLIKALSSDSHKQNYHMLTACNQTNTPTLGFAEKIAHLFWKIGLASGVLEVNSLLAGRQDDNEGAAVDNGSSSKTGAKFFTTISKSGCSGKDWTSAGTTMSEKTAFHCTLPIWLNTELQKHFIENNTSYLLLLSQF